jgi:hypothetical protein
MPLPTTREKVFYIDKDSQIKDDQVVRTKDTGYAPSDDYYPTMRACKCSGCGTIGHMTFDNGFSIRLGDRIMDGKPIPGRCYRCNKTTEMVPLPVNDPNNADLRHYYNIQKSLDFYRKRGMQLASNSVLWDPARIMRLEEHVRRQQAAQQT